MNIFTYSGVQRKFKFDKTSNLNIFTQESFITIVIDTFLNIFIIKCYSYINMKRF